MKLGYVTRYDAHDRTKWSGLGYYLARALIAQSHTVEFVGPLRMSRPWIVWAKKAFYTQVRKQRYLPDRAAWVVRDYARQASHKLSRLDVDVVFSPGTIPIGYLESAHPVVVWTDSTFAGMVDFYPDFTNLCAETLRHGSALEAAALSRARLVIYSSDWAAQTATRAYGLARDKVHVVPFGANIDASPTPDVVRQIVCARSTTVCRLLFLGVAWFRKGGDVAIEIARQLNAAGLPTELAVVGSRPRIAGRHPSWLHYYGMIGKSSSSRLAELTALLSTSHFLVLPTRADCTPVVLSEANAFGVPCLASRVGGIPSIVRDGLNGATFEPNAVADYCDYILTHFANQPRYQDLALSAFHEYQTRLNWSVAGRAVSDLLADVTR